MKQEKSQVTQIVISYCNFLLDGVLPYPSLLTPCSEIGATLTQAGLIVGSYGFTQMILRFPLGVYADHIVKRNFYCFRNDNIIISSLGLFLRRMCS